MTLTPCPPPRGHPALCAERVDDRRVSVSGVHYLGFALIPIWNQLRLDLAKDAELDAALDEIDDGLQHLLGVVGRVGDDDDGEGGRPGIVEVGYLGDTGVELVAYFLGDGARDQTLVFETEGV